MKAVTFQGPQHVEVSKVEDAKIEKSDDIVVRITSTAICGSDLHLYQGNFPLPKGFQLGHEPMGIVEETGPEVTKVKKETGSSSRLPLPADIAFIAKTSWKASATMPIPIMIQADTSVTRKSSETTLADRLNI